MMRVLSVIASVLLMAGSCYGQVTVVENPSPQSSFVEASAKIEVGQSVTWFVVPEPTKQVEIDNIVYFNGPAGTYHITALVQTVKDNKVVNKKYKAVVVIGTPTPPSPPEPPPAPKPVDQFTKDIQTAFTAETAPDKALNTQKLASLYRVSAKSTVTDKSITTYGQLFDTMKIASVAMLPESAIPGVRKVIGARINPQFGAASKALDDASRTKLVSEFNAIADALSSAK